MGTTIVDSWISPVLFSRSRQAVLALLLGHPDESFYLREIVRLTKAGQGAVQRELQRLVTSGVLLRWERGNQVYFQANVRCPVFPELRGLLLKTAGLVDVLRLALEPLAPKMALAFVYGSMARREQHGSSDVDLCIVGDV